MFRSNPRRWLILSSIAAFLVLITFHRLQHIHGFSTAKAYDCQDPGNLAIIVKTGATEAMSRLPAQLSTSLRCVEALILASDLAQRIEDHEIHDVLANVTPVVMEYSKDFEIYRLQQEFARNGREDDIASLVDMPVHFDDWRAKGKNAAWNLDKYKNLHEVELAWNLAPHKDWYLFIDADTYLNWPNLLQWLETLDPRQKLFFGNAVQMHEHPFEFYFGHGGSGNFLSGAVVKDFIYEKPGLANRWDSRWQDMIFGDYGLAVALHEELGLKIADASPSFTGDSPAEIPWHEGRWCQPIITLHHMDHIEQEQMMLHELSHQNQILRYRDIYLARAVGELPPRRDDWHNVADDLFFELPPNPTLDTSSIEACQSACDLDEQCLQYMFVDDGDRSYCFLSKTFRFGRARAPILGEGSTQVWTSGWRNDRIADFVANLGSCDESEVNWPR